MLNNRQSNLTGSVFVDEFESVETSNVAVDVRSEEEKAFNSKISDAFDFEA